MRFAISIILIFVTLSVGAEQYSLTHFDEPAGLAESFIYSIVQDHNGYLWLGTSDGLYRFDGISYKYYTRSDSLADNFITSAYSHLESVWVGHQNGELTYIHENTLKIVRLPVKDMSSIVKFRTNHGGDLWFASYSNGLFRIRSNEKIEQYVFEEEGITVHDFQFLRENRLLVGSDDGLRICQLNINGSIQVIKRFVDVPKSKIVSILHLATDRFIVATQGQGVFILDLSNNSVSVATILSQAELKENLVTSLLLDNQNNLWITSFGGGLLRLSDINNTTTTKYFEKKWFSEQSCRLEIF